MNTDTIYSTALAYASYAGIETDMETIIPRMLEDLLNLAEEYAVTVEWGEEGIRAYA